MQNLIIKCISESGLSGKYHILIFDKCNNIIVNKYTKNGVVKVCLKKGLYKIIIAPLDINVSMQTSTFIVTDETTILNFYFKKNDNFLKITLFLVDKKYNNLPIERGKIELWQNHIS